jgi:predicted lipopolysaccharide heptosyltransferase III
MMRFAAGEKILLLQLGDIGDVVWTVPAVWALKAAYPQAGVSMLVRGGIGPLIAAEPSLEKVFEVRRSPGGLLRRGREQVRLLKTLRRERFAAAIDLRADDRGAFIARLTGAPARVALRYRRGVPFWRNRLFTHLVDPSLPAERGRGAAEQSLRILRGMGVLPRDRVPRLPVSREAALRAQDLLRREKIPEDGRWITVNPFSRWRYKEWGLNRWSEILGWVWRRYGAAAVIVGAPEERERAAVLEAAGKGTVFNLAGKTGLGELAGVLRASSLHAGVDSAAPHIAAAVGTPTVTLYGPSDWYEWAPVGEAHRVVLPERACVPCLEKGCAGGGRSLCLEEMGVDRVKAVMEEALDRIFFEKSFFLS